MSFSQVELVTRFGVWDYVVFSGMLAVSAAIGLYYGCTGGKQSTTSEFLMADRNMGVFPVALSLLASFMSAITLLGTPAEIYNYSSIYILVALGYCITIPVAAHLYLPVFSDLNVTSSYEYLEKRFSKTIRRCGSLTFIIQMTMYMAIVLYAPALALSQVTGLHVWGSVVAIGIVCTFYTTIGGMKAVMWTDAFQMIIMFGAMLTVFIKGCYDAGGFEYVWQKNVEGNRIIFNDFNPDPRIRHSFWSLMIGGYFTWICIYGVNQAQVQRYLTTPNMRIAQMALWWNLPGLIFLLTICCFGGLVIYATYWNCDPLSSNQIETSDQLLPLFVMDTLGNLPGLPGLFVAGVFSGALSTISSGMNSLAAVTLEDLVRSCFPNMKEKTATITSKFLALFYGLLCIALVAVAEQLGNVLQAALSIFGIVGGPLLGVFTLGMFIPWANSWGAGCGLIAGFSISFWIGFSAQIYKKFIHFDKGIVSVAGCLMNSTENLTQAQSTETNVFFTTEVNNATNISPEDVSDAVLEIYKVSYLWYSAIACITVVVVGIIVSFLTGKQDPTELDPLVFSPVTRKLLGYSSSSDRTATTYQSSAEYGMDKQHAQDEFIVHKYSNGKEITMKDDNLGIENYAYQTTEQNHYEPVLQSNGEYTTSL